MNHGSRIYIVWNYKFYVDKTFDEAENFPDDLIILFTKRHFELTQTRGDYTHRLHNFNFISRRPEHISFKKHDAINDKKCQSV